MIFKSSNRKTSVSLKKHQNWFVDNVIKYHRTISTILNDLIQVGFTIKSVNEPTPSQADLKKKPDLAGHVERPPILIVEVIR